LGTLSVLVVISWMRAGDTPSERAATASILVCRPWPISVPPWLSCTLPSAYTCTSAPALVVHGLVERDAELDRRDRDAALGLGMRAVVRVDRGAACVERAVLA
jgi:hypothetical protein